MLTIRHFFQKLIARWWKPAPPAVSPTDQAAVARLMVVLTMTAEEEFGCEQVQALLDEYADYHFAGEDTAVLMPLVEAHLHECGLCREEFQMLLEMMRATTSHP